MPLSSGDTRIPGMKSPAEKIVETSDVPPAMPGSPSSGNTRSLLPIALVLAVTAVYRLLSFGHVPLTGFDEHVYAFYSRTLSDGGVPALREAIAAWDTDPRLRSGPLPLRVAFVAVGSLGVRLAGGDGTVGIAAVSLLSGLALMLLGTGLAVRWLPRDAAIVAATLLGTSPLAAALSTRALQDTFVAALFAAVLLLLDRALVTRRSRDAAMLLPLLTVCFLAKESTLFMYPVFLVVYGLRQGYHHRVVTSALALVFAAAPLLAVAVMAWVAGSFDRLWTVYAAYQRAQGEIPYALAYQQGPWFRYLVDFVLVAPAVCIAAAAGIFGAGGGARAGTRALAPATLAVLLVVFTGLPLMNLRLVLFADVPLRMLAAAGIVDTARRLRPGCRERRLSIVGAALLLALLDIVAYQTLFAGGRTYDPVTAALVRSLGLAP